MKLLKALSIVLFISFLAIGCGSSSEDANTTPVQSLSITGYQEQQGDIFTYQTTINVKDYLGNEESETFSETNKFSKVDSIPSKYSYSGDIAGPYILNTETENGELDGYEFTSLSGESIINDNLKTFTSIDAQTKSGSDKPVNLSTGDSFTYSKDSTLFDSGTGEDVGSIVLSANYIVKGSESISVPAGTFQALKVDYNYEMTKTVNGISEESKDTGSIWIDIVNGYLVKQSINISLYRNNIFLGDGTFDSVLLDYQTGISINNKITQKKDVFLLNRSSITKKVIKLVSKSWAGHI